MLAPRIGKNFLKPIKSASNGFIALLMVKALNATYIPPINDMLKIIEINANKVIGNALAVKYSVKSSILPLSKRIDAELK